MKNGMIVQPFAPGTLHGRRGPWVFLRGQQMTKPCYSPAQRPNGVLSHEAVMWVDYVSQKVNALATFLKHNLVRVQLQVQTFTQKGFYLGFPNLQGTRVVSQQHKIVYIPHIAPNFQVVFDKLVQFVQIDIGKKLAGQAPNGHAHMRQRPVKRFVRRYTAQQCQVSTAFGGGVYRVLAQDGLCHLVQHSSGGNRPGQARQRILPQLQQNAPVYTGKECADVKLTIPVMSRLAHEVLQAGYGYLSAFAFSIGEAVVNESAVPPRFYVPHQPLVHKPVGEGRGKNFTQFRVGNSESGEGFRGVPSLRNSMGLSPNDLWQMDEVRTLLFTVASFCGTGEQLVGNCVGSGRSVCQGV